LKFASELQLKPDRGVDFDEAKLRDLLIDEKLEAHTTELAMTETMYILCGKYGLNDPLWPGKPQLKLYIPGAV